MATQVKYSVLVTAYDPDQKLVEMTTRCLDSVQACSEGQDYELIVDTGPQPGLFAAYNRLFKKAKGEYLIVIPNDTIIRDKNWLQALAIPGYITSWHIGTFLLTGKTEPDGGVTCYPRHIFDQVGLYDEKFDEGYGFGDNDWFHRATLLNIPYKEVKINITHEGNTTYQTYWPGEKQLAMYHHNEQLFKDKWQLK